VIDEFTLTYCLNKKSGDKWAIAGLKDKVQMFNQEDRRINGDQFKEMTGLDPFALLKEAEEKHHSDMKSSRDSYSKMAEELENTYFGNIEKRDKRIESLLMKTKHSDSIYKYVSALGNKTPEHILVVAVAIDDSNLEPGQYAREILSLIDPSEKVQLLAVRHSSRILEYIDNPTEKVQLLGIKESPFHITSIENPTERVQMKAVERDIRAYHHIKNPAPSVTKKFKELERENDERLNRFGRMGDEMLRQTR